MKLLDCEGAAIVIGKITDEIVKEQEVLNQHLANESDVLEYLHATLSAKRIHRLCGIRMRVMSDEMTRRDFDYANRLLGLD